MVYLLKLNRHRIDTTHLLVDNLLEVKAVGGIGLAAHGPHAQLVGRALEESLGGAEGEVQVLAEGAERDVVRLDGTHFRGEQVVAARGESLVLQFAVVGVLAEILFHVVWRQGGVDLWPLADAPPPAVVVVLVVLELHELIVGHCVVGVHVED